MSELVFDISRFPDVPIEVLVRVKHIFLYVRNGAILGDGKVSYRFLNNLLRNRMTDQEFRAAFEFLLNLQVIREEEDSLSGEPEDIGPGEWEIETVVVEPNMESEFVIEFTGKRDRQ